MAILAVNKSVDPIVGHDAKSVELPAVTLLYSSRDLLHNSRQSQFTTCKNSSFWKKVSDSPLFSFFRLIATRPNQTETAPRRSRANYTAGTDIVHTSRFLYLFRGAYGQVQSKGTGAVGPERFLTFFLCSDSCAWCSLLPNMGICIPCLIYSITMLFDSKPPRPGVWNRGDKIHYSDVSMCKSEEYLILPVR